jgi:hypothetical protein
MCGGTGRSRLILLGDEKGNRAGSVVGVHAVVGRVLSVVTMFNLVDKK